MGYFKFLDSDLSTELSIIDFGHIPAGKSYSKKLGLKNDSQNDYDNCLLSFFANHRNNQFENTSGTPVVSADIIKMSATTEQIQKVDVDKDDADGELTKRTSYRGRCYAYDDDATPVWTDYSTGDVYFADDPDRTMYIGSEHIFFNIKFTFSTAGSYTGVTYQYWNGSAWTNLPSDYSDGTSGLSTNGTLFLGSLESLWEKCIISNAPVDFNQNMYWIKITVTSVTTQAIASEVIWEYVYDAPKTLWYGNSRTFYQKTDDATPVYTTKTPDSEYPLQGIFAFKQDPLDGHSTYLLVADYSYKTPQPGTYDLTFPTTSSCSVNGGSAVSITADGQTQNTNVIPGIAIVFSSSLSISDTATITVSDGAEFIYFAEDTGGGAGTWQNEDYDLGTITAGNTESFYMGIFTLSTKSVSDNTPYFKPFIVGELN